jgi:hypothetical protein
MRSHRAISFLFDHKLNQIFIHKANKNIILQISRYSDSLRGWTAEVRFPAGSRDISLFHSVQIGSGVLSASFPLGTGALPPGREADHSLPSTAAVKNDGAIPPLPMGLHGKVKVNLSL